MLRRSDMQVLVRGNDLLDKTEAIQSDDSKIPFVVRALDKRGATLKEWEFDSKAEMMKALYEIHDEWWEHKKKQRKQDV